MNVPLITVIIPVYNVEQYLSKCLNSVMTQTYQNLEIILINDGSTDDSRKIIDEYAKRDSRIRVIHQVNRGLSYARNVGIENARGDYISFIDSDDYVAIDCIQKLYRAIIDYNSDLSSASFYNVYNERVVPSRTRTKKTVSGETVANEFLVSVLGNDNRAAWGKLYKREMIINNNLSFPVGKRHEDLAFLFESFCLSKKVSFVGEPLYFYVHRGGSITTSSNSDIDYDYDMVEVADMIPDIAKKYTFVSKKSIARFLLEKRLSYVYTRVRKGSNMTHFDEVRCWLVENKEVVRSNYIPRKDKIMVAIIGLGQLPVRIFFSGVAICVRVMKLRGTV